jgi:hypothetical protein
MMNYSLAVSWVDRCRQANCADRDRLDMTPLGSYGKPEQRETAAKTDTTVSVERAFPNAPVAYTT